jgi:hypothetical protein
MMRVLAKSPRPSQARVLPLRLASPFRLGELCGPPTRVRGLIPCGFHPIGFGAAEALIGVGGVDWL